MKPQCQRLLDHLEKGNVITNLEGWQRLGIYAVSQRIGDLIKQGHPISKAWKVIYNRYGEKIRVKAYWIPRQK